MMSTSESTCSGGAVVLDPVDRFLLDGREDHTEQRE